ncbi:MAG: hypothetical protein ACRBFS_21005 [Aureispira sp.]
MLVLLGILAFPMDLESKTISLPIASQQVEQDVSTAPPAKRKKKYKKQKRKRRKKIFKEHQKHSPPSTTQTTWDAMIVLEPVISIIVILSSLGGYTLFLLSIFIASFASFWFLGVVGFVIIPIIFGFFALLFPDAFVNPLPALLISAAVLVYGGVVANLIIGLVLGISVLWIPAVIVLGAAVLAGIIALFAYLWGW